MDNPLFDIVSSSHPEWAYGIGRRYLDDGTELSRHKAVSWLIVAATNFPDDPEVCTAWREVLHDPDPAVVLEVLNRAEFCGVPIQLLDGLTPPSW